MHEHLGGYVRDGLAERDNRRVREHLDVCVVCSKSYLELASVNSEMRTLIGPVVLGGAAAAYLGTETTGGLGVGVLLGRARDVVALHAKTAAVAAIGTTVAVATVTTALVTHNAQPDPAADGTTGDTTSQPPTRPPASTSTRHASHRPSPRPTTSAAVSPSARPSSTPRVVRPATKKPRKHAPSGAASARASRTSGTSTPRANVAVTVGRSGGSGTMTGGRWFVSGVPSDKTVLLTVTAPSGVALASTDCPGAGTRLSCRVGNGDGSFEAVNTSGDPQQVILRVAPAPGFADPQMANNVASLTAD